LAITSPTSGGRSVGIVRSRTQTMEFSLVLLNSFHTILNTDLNILTFYTTTCFRLTVTTAFALLYI
jgi:hypothetical protein